MKIWKEEIGFERWGVLLRKKRKPGNRGDWVGYKTNGGFRLVIKVRG